MGLPMILACTPGFFWGNGHNGGYGVCFHTPSFSLGCLKSAVSRMSAPSVHWVHRGLAGHRPAWQPAPGAHTRRWGGRYGTHPPDTPGTRNSALYLPRPTLARSLLAVTG